MIGSVCLHVSRFTFIAYAKHNSMTTYFTHCILEQSLSLFGPLPIVYVAFYSFLLGCVPNIIVCTTSTSDAFFLPVTVIFLHIGGFATILQKARGHDDELNTVAAGTISGLLFKSTGMSLFDF